MKNYQPFGIVLKNLEIRFQVKKDIYLLRSMEEVMKNTNHRS